MIQTYSTLVFAAEPQLKILTSSGIFKKGGKNTLNDFVNRKRCPWKDLVNCFSDGWHLRSLQGVSVKRERVLLLFDMHRSIKQWAFATAMMHSIPIDRKLRDEAYYKETRSCK